jgi:tetratricopeptide (TPR) repeat protein
MGLFFLFSFPVFAQRKGEESLSRADALIEENQFNEAAAVLALYLRENPGGIEQVRRRVRRMAEIRGRYGGPFNDRLSAVTPDAADPKTSGPDLRGDIGNPPRSRRSFLRPLDLASSSVGGRQLEEILIRGRELTQRGDYSGAMEVYEEGLEIYRDQLVARNSGGERENLVRDQFFRLVDTADAFETVLEGLGKDAAELKAASPEEVAPIYGRVQAGLNILEGIEKDLFEGLRFFEEKLQDLQDGNAAPEDGASLFFPSRLIYGWSGDSGQDGMIHTLRASWARRTAALESLLTAPAAESYNRALAEARDRRYREAAEDYRKTEERCALIWNLLKANRVFWEGAGMPVERIPDMPYSAGFIGLTGQGPGIVNLLSRDFAVSCSGKVEALELRLDNLLRESAGPSLPEEKNREIRAGFKALAEEAEVLDAELQEGEREFRRRFENLEYPSGAENREVLLSLALTFRDDDISRYTGEALGLLKNFQSRCGETELAWILRRDTALNAGIRERLDRREAVLALAKRLNGGLRREEALDILTRAGVDSPVLPGSPEDGEARFRYPREARDLLERLAEETEEDLVYAGNLAGYYEEDQRVPDGLGALQSSVLETLRSLEDIRRQGAEELRLAEDRINRADSFLSQGDRGLREAQEAMDRGDFTAALNFIQLAAERYNESLSFQESPPLQQRWDTQVLVLGREISRLENEAVIRDVRNALNQARDEYFAENFSNAERLLIQGQHRWRTTNVEENPEINYWLSIVRGALTLRSDRVIPDTAPLFKEMGQLLSDAYRDYEDGAASIKALRRDEGLALFDNARQNIREVKLVFPLNQDAGMLELRMEQVTDPETFHASFRRRLDEAVAGTKRRSVEAFADLQNLAEIDPAYPGISAALRQAEIDMGYRSAPPDPEKIRRSDELTRAAQIILRDNNRGQFEAALRQLNEAIALNSGNTQAAILKDQVQTRMGVGNAVLTSADEGEYQRAVRELQQGNTLIAAAIVEQLFQNPRNHDSTRILELRRRIQSVL